jgi:hypothetical protein
VNIGHPGRRLVISSAKHIAAVSDFCRAIYRPNIPAPPPADRLSSADNVKHPGNARAGDTSRRFF